MQLAKSRKHDRRNLDPEVAIRRVLLTGAMAARTNRLDVRVEPVANGYRVTANYEVELLDASRGRYLLFDYASCPFAITEIETDVGTHRDVGPELYQRMLLIECDRPATSRTASIRMAMEWKPEHIEANSRVPYLVAPDHFPRLIVGGVTGIVRSVAPVHLVVERPEDFQHATLQLDGEWTTEQSGPHLQVALLPTPEISAVGSRLLLVGSVIAATSDETRSAIAEELKKTVDFLGAQLGVEPALRLALVADEQENEIAGALGVLLVDNPKYFGIGSDNFRFLAVWSTMVVAAVWWGVGVRLHGTLGESLAGAIAQALCLWRLRLEEDQIRLNRVLESTQKRADRAVASTAPLVERSGMLVARGALQLYEAFDRGGGVLAELRSMTQEYWGHEVPPELVLSRLRAVGVSIPAARYRLA